MKEASSTMFNFVLFILISLLTIVTVYNCQDATSEDIAKVVNIAENNLDSKAEIKKFLNAKQIPSNSELRELNSHIEQIKTRDIVRKATGDNTIEAKYVADLEYKEKVKADTMYILNQFRFTIAGININILFLAFGLVMISGAVFFIISSFKKI